MLKDKDMEEFSGSSTFWYTKIMDIMYMRFSKLGYFGQLRDRWSWHNRTGQDRRVHGLRISAE
jgi:hypothetical protein